MGKKQLLWYEAPPKVHAALLRGTTADLDGNISFEREALYLDSLNMVCGLTAHMSQCSMCCKADLVLAQEHSGCCQAWFISKNMHVLHCSTHARDTYIRFVLLACVRAT